MVTSIYFVTFIISVLSVTYYLVNNQKTDSLFVVLGFGVVCVCGGRFLISIAETLELAVVANKILYLGACICPLFAVLITAKLCDIHLSNYVKYLLGAYNAIVFLMTLTIGYNDFYYRRAILVKTHEYHYLEKFYGPGHFFYQLMLAVFIVMILAMTIYAFSHKNSVSYRTTTVIGSFAIILMLIYLIERIMDLNISYLSIGYLVLSVCMISLSERINMYDMSKNIMLSVERMKSYGYIEFDKKYRFMGSNEYVEDIFPEIKSWNIDQKIPPSDSFLYRNVIEWVMQHEENDKFTIHINGQYLEMTVRDLIYGKSRKVGTILELIDRTVENKYLAKVENYNDDLEKEVEEKTSKITYIKDMMVLGMATMVESRDNSTGGHIKRTSICMRIFANHLLDYTNELNISREFVDMITKAAPMHDLGKIAVDDCVLRKKGKYTEEEYNEMKKHSLEGKKIIEEILRGVEEDAFVDVCSNVAHYHHEKWDGSGYPEGISKLDIPMEARIMALVDVFDALVSKRCYKEAYSYDKAFKIIEESLGSHFDPYIGQIFLECRPKLEVLYDEFRIEEDLDNFNLLATAE